MRWRHGRVVCASPANVTWLPFGFRFLFFLRSRSSASWEAACSYRVTRDNTAAEAMHVEDGSSRSSSEHTCDQQVAPERPQAFLCAVFPPSITRMVETRRWMATVAREIIQWSDEFCLKLETDCSISSDCLFPSELKWPRQNSNNSVSCSSEEESPAYHKPNWEASRKKNSNTGLIYVKWEKK